MMDNGTALPGELVSVPEVTAGLLELARLGKQQDVRAYKELFAACGCKQPDLLFDELRGNGVLVGSPTNIFTSSRGYKTLLFLSGALGRPSSSIFDELRALEPSLQRYDLVREGMTSRFISGLISEPGFRRLYICSPWINVLQKDLARLAIALDTAARSSRIQPEILVLVQTPKLPEVKKSLASLQALGAKIVEKPKLHSKLYMREPGASGGLSLAIVGSENLTRPKWIELGIEIRNDTHIFSRLRNYFFDVYGSLSGE
jgi:hypothetical protein